MLFLNKRLDGIANVRNPDPELKAFRDGTSSFVELFQPLRITMPIWHKFPNLV